MKTVGVVLAGGSGLRFGGSVPKQYIKLAGRMVIEHTVDVFERSQCIDEIFIVTQPDYLDFTAAFVAENRWTKVTRVLVGGKERMDSTLAAIEAMGAYPEDTRILFHDAVRPFVTEEILQRCVTALRDFGAVDVVISSLDTLVSVQDSGSIAAIPPRASMRRGQTPQAFRLNVIKAAYEKAYSETRRDFTCDCGVVKAMLPDAPVVTVEGADSNIKITTPLDHFLAEKLMQSRSISIEDSDTKLRGLKGKRIVLFGGSSGIGAAIRNVGRIHEAEMIVASRSENGVDVSDAAAVGRFMAHVGGSGGQIDAVINTAGVLVKKPFARMTEADIHRIVATNYLGALNIATASYPYLAKSKGTLVYFTSGSYTRGRAFYAVHSSTKGAIVNLTQALAEEWNDQGIKVQCINPSRTDTPMRTSNFGIEDGRSLLSAEFVARHTLGAVLSPQSGLVVDVRRANI